MTNGRAFQSLGNFTDSRRYGKANKPLPSDARGLFSHKTESDNYDIVIRGYDKFFNIDEVAYTHWSDIETSTRGPYDLSLKQNGCIIFIGALPDNTLLVTSKHSIGSRPDMEISHSERGEFWLRKHLAKVGRTPEELANLLNHFQLTAVAELCDDEFEEHILQYPPEASGLYLHGLNLNTVTFVTYPPDSVMAFAEYFGLLSNKSIRISNIKDLRIMLAECGKSGTYEGVEIEGFVIRCERQGLDFFFKYKFEEPYLMFRNWRELTKLFIKSGTLPPPNRIKKHKAITSQYLCFVQKVLSNEKAREDYQRNHGIIKLRNQFLKEWGGDLSSQIANTDDREDRFQPTSSDPPAIRGSKIVLVPVATIGCGKTTIALALAKLFGFGHIQNDNILAKKAAPHFAKDVADALKSHRVVVADRNNHMRHERESLTRDVSKLVTMVDFIALNFEHHDKEVIRKVTEERIFARGDNHQSIKASSSNPGFTKGIMSGFLGRFEAFSDREQEFAGRVDLDPVAESRINLEKVVVYLREKGIVERDVTKQEMDDAIHEAMTYKPQITKIIKKRDFGQEKKELQTESVTYYAASVKDLVLFRKDLSNLFAQHPAWDQSFWLHLNQTNRLQPEFHATLIHSFSKKQWPDIWTLYADHKVPDRITLTAKSLVFDGNIMALIVGLPDGIPSVNIVPHITLGTKDASIKPFEANSMLQKEGAIVYPTEEFSIDCTIHAVT